MFDPALRKKINDAMEPLVVLLKPGDEARFEPWSDKKQRVIRVIHEPHAYGAGKSGYFYEITSPWKSDTPGLPNTITVRAEEAIINELEDFLENI